MRECFTSTVVVVVEGRLIRHCVTAFGRRGLPDETSSRIDRQVRDVGATGGQYVLEVLHNKDGHDGCTNEQLEPDSPHNGRIAA